MIENKYTHGNLIDQGYLVPVFSGGPGGGKSSLANRIAKMFNVPVVSAGTILREKHKLLYPDNSVSFEDWYGTQNGQTVKELNDEIKVIFESGAVVGESRFIGHLDASKCLFVYVDADITIKAERLSKDQNRRDYYGKSTEEIAQILKRRTLDEIKVGQELAQLYGIGGAYDYRDPKHYNLYIDSGVTTLEEEVTQVLALMKK
jgi:cytidylate kinase